MERCPRHSRSAQWEERASQELLGTGENVLEATVAADGETQRSGESFEQGFDLMMRGAPIKAAQMNVGAGGLCKSLEKIFEQLDGKVADAIGFDLCVDNAMRAAADVDCGGGESFVHRHQEISGAKNSFFRAERFLHSFAEGDADVFDRVVLIDVEIALGADGEIECTVTSDEIEHVMEKTDACGDFGFTAAVDCEA